AWVEFRIHSEPRRELKYERGAQIRARGPKPVGASRIIEDQMKIDALRSKCLVIGLQLV
ncbi:hypothetical protein Tco_0592277, partial [Tanacetum coccineum]